MRFTKMHGAGNDYVYVDAAREQVDDPAALARKLADRHTGVGGDGLILILPPTSADADVRMRMFNLDGSEGAMCGNGVRCVAKYARDHGLTTADPVRVETKRGVLAIGVELGPDGKVARATVDMREPILELDRIPVKQGALGRNALFKKRGEHEYALAMEVNGEVVVASFVSMGNPHLVTFVKDVAAVDLARLGPKLEAYPAFPDRANVHFAQVLDEGRVRVRHWERGSGATRACGTGACAVVVAGALTGRTGRKAVVEVPGGELEINWHADGRVFLTGPAAEVFSGEIEV